MTGVVRAVGTMSGTSLDGVDAAEIVTDGERIVRFGATGYRPYDDEERSVLARALGAWEGPRVAAAARVVDAAHADLLGRFESPSVVGFHGQTLAHEPGGRGTLQAGNGDALAEALGVPVAWDFRSADVAAGGQGAPLAPFFHFACARWAGLSEPVAFLNLGGVGNLTQVDPRQEAPEAPGACFAFDTGPANAPIDDLMRARTGEAFDRDGATAAAGKVDAALVAAVLSNSYFRARAPKSLDRNAFATALAPAADLPLADAAATFAAIAAAAVTAGLDLCQMRPERLLVTGGGRRNPVMLRMLAERADLPVEPVEAVGLDGDMLEAQAFGFLAVRVLRGLALTAPGTTGVPAPCRGGRLARPARRAA